MLQPLVRRTWAKCGKTPILKAWDRHDRLTVITAVVWEPHRRREFSMYFQIKRHNANADTFLWFLVDLLHELNNHMIVIWDRLGGHRKAAKAIVELELPWITFELLACLLSRAQSSGTRLVNNQVWKASQLASAECRLASRQSSTGTRPSVRRPTPTQQPLSMGKAGYQYVTLPAQ